MKDKRERLRAYENLPAARFWPVEESMIEYASKTLASQGRIVRLDCSTVRKLLEKEAANCTQLGQPFVLVPGVAAEPGGFRLILSSEGEILWVEHEGMGTPTTLRFQPLVVQVERVPKRVYTYFVRAD